LLKDVHWHGDSLDVVREFPRTVRIDVGSEIYLLQLGRPPLHSKPISSVGRGVWEIRVKDESGAFRVFFIVRRNDGIHVLHAFQKKAQKTRKSDIELGKSRLKDYNKRSRWWW
jgi:phage-related protein